MSQIVKCFAQLDPVCSLLVFEALHPSYVLFKFNSQAAPDSDPMFSKRRIAETLTYGYLEMLGTLSKHKEGIESVSSFFKLECTSPYLHRILENYKIFTAFYHLSDLKSRDDLIKGIIENLDYSTYEVFKISQVVCHITPFRDGHPRIVLSKALTSSHKVSPSLMFPNS